MWNHWIWRANWIGLHSILGFRNPPRVLEAVPHGYRRTTVPRCHWVIRLLKSSKFQVKLSYLKKLQKCHSQKDCPSFAPDGHVTKAILNCPFPPSCVYIELRKEVVHVKICRKIFNMSFQLNMVLRIQNTTPQNVLPFGSLIYDTRLSNSHAYRTSDTGLSEPPCVHCRRLGLWRSRAPPKPKERYSGTTHGLHLSPVSVVPWAMSHTIRDWPSWTSSPLPRALRLDSCWVHSPRAWSVPHHCPHLLLFRLSLILEICFMF